MKTDHHLFYAACLVLRGHARDNADLVSLRRLTDFEGDESDVRRSADLAMLSNYPHIASELLAMLPPDSAHPVERSGAPEQRVDAVDAEATCPRPEPIRHLALDVGAEVRGRMQAEQRLADALTAALLETRFVTMTHGERPDARGALMPLENWEAVIAAVGALLGGPR